MSPVPPRKLKPVGENLVAERAADEAKRRNERASPLPVFHPGFGPHLGAFVILCCPLRTFFGSRGMGTSATPQTDRGSQLAPIVLPLSSRWRRA